MFDQLSSYLKLSFLFALMATSVGRCSAETPPVASTVLTDSIPPPAPTKYKDMFVTWEIMPLFPGSDATKRYAERKHQADSLMLSFIYSNLRYPQAAMRDSVQGMAVVSFVVEKDGLVTGGKVVRNPGAGTGEEALRVINLMAERNLRWVPGTQMGKPVRVQFNMPVKFKITNKTIVKPPPPAPPPPLSTDCSDIFKVVEEMPRFPGCEELVDGAERKNCADRKLIEYVYGNLKLPKGFATNCGYWSETAVVQFCVEKNGMVSDAKIIRGRSDGVGNSALAVVNAMNDKGIRWTPGRQGGRAVRVQFNLPVKFKLQ